MLGACVWGALHRSAKCCRHVLGMLGNHKNHEIQKSILRCYIAERHDFHEMHEARK